MEMLGQGGDHRRGQDVGDVLHDGVRPPALDKGSQLVLDVQGLLPRESRHGKITAITLRL